MECLVFTSVSSSGSRGLEARKARLDVVMMVAMDVIFEAELIRPWHVLQRVKIRSLIQPGLVFACKSDALAPSRHRPLPNYTSGDAGRFFLEPWYVYLARSA